MDFEKLTRNNILKFVPKNSTGIYFLGDKDIKNGFVVRYVGRSDTRLRQRLLDHLNKSYKHFSFELKKTILDAYKVECREWHNDFPLDNLVHPRKPKNLNYFCPYCKKGRGGFKLWER